MKRSIIMFVAIYILLGSCVQDTENNITIQNLEMFSGVSTTNFGGKDIEVNSDYYVVKGIKDLDSLEPIFDSLICNMDSSAYLPYHTYYAYFYKESRRTNIENLSKFERDLDRYSNQNDLIYTYKWNGKETKIKTDYWTRKRFRKGKQEKRIRIPCKD